MFIFNCVVNECPFQKALDYPKFLTPTFFPLPLGGSCRPASGLAHFQFEDDEILDQRGCLDHIALLLGGRAAEGADLHRASDLATRLELQLGMGEGLAYFNLKSIEQRDCARQINPVVTARVERLVAREMVRSREIVTSFRAAVERIADVLVEEAIIEGDAVRRIIRGASR